MKNMSSISFILDRSGSMQTIKNDTIGNFNSFIETQKKTPGEATLELIQFSDHGCDESTFNGDIQAVPGLTQHTFTPHGCTALLDCIGNTVDSLGERLSKMKEEDRPEHVIVVILTDGEENNSKKFTWAQISDKIKHQQDNYKWQFLFLGANQDAIATAGKMHIPGTHAMNYTADAKGTQQAYVCTAHVVSNMRGGSTRGYSGAP